jgi:hypothetical protein
MTIKQQIRAIMEHPFYREALHDSKCMERLLFEVMFEVYGTVSANCSRAYRMVKRMNTPEIISAIRDIEPPSNLDIRLPIPQARQSTPVVVMQVAHVSQPELRIRYPKHPVSPHIVANQMIICFEAEKPLVPIVDERLSEFREG